MCSIQSSLGGRMTMGGVLGDRMEMGGVFGVFIVNIAQRNLSGI